MHLEYSYVFFFVFFSVVRYLITCMQRPDVRTFGLLTFPSVPSTHTFHWPVSYTRLQCRDTFTFLWNLRHLWPTIPDLITPQHCSFWAQIWQRCMRHKFVWVCVYIKHIIDDEDQASGKMLGNNSYSSSMVSGHCADVWAKELKQATVHMRSCQCCGPALASFSEAGGLCFKRLRDGNNQILSWSEEHKGM